MPLIARDTAKQYQPHPEGQFIARCVDAIDLGERVEAFPGTPEKLVPKLALIFATGEVNELGQPIYPTMELSHFFSEKASLRKHLESWRGKPYTAAEAREGVDIEKLIGHPATLQIAHKVSPSSGRTYAVIQSITPVHPKLRNEAPSVEGYERPAYWAERMAEYAEKAEAFRARISAPSAAATKPAKATTPDPLSDDHDDLPFNAGVR